MNAVIKLKKRGVPVHAMAENQAMHFYASSASTWATTGPDRNLSELLELMNKEGLIYSLWMLPVPPDTPYSIEGYQPKVEGAQWVGVYVRKL